MKIAVYSRKSKLSERGESIQNQIELCKAYAFSSFGAAAEDITVYEDEGFSGGSTDRPQFLRLMDDISNKKFDALICYRLDRISRNVLDFSNILEKLNTANTSFISITERFDTATPMGRAMVNIAAVFAQLERETTAERIRDNMRRLAMTGRYLGSTPPLGFTSETVEYADPAGNKKKLHRLAAIAEDIAFVELVFDKYLEFKSLSRLETWLMQNSYTSRNGNFPGTSELRRLLSNPVYVRADISVYTYYNNLGAQVVNPAAEFNGVYGMLIYGRHDRNRGSYAPAKWTVVLAAHEGVIDSRRWLSVQRILEENKTRAPRAGTSRNALLTSKIRCGHCGSAMVVTYGADKLRHYYKCRNKIRSRKAVCDIANISGGDADEAVFQYLACIPYDFEKAAEILKTRWPDAARRRQADSNPAKKLHEKEQAIKNLMTQLRKNENSSAAKYIISDIEKLDKELSELKHEIIKQSESSSGQKTHTAVTADIYNFEEKRAFIESLVNKIIWDESGFRIHFK